MPGPESWCMWSHVLSGGRYERKASARCSARGDGARMVSVLVGEEGSERVSGEEADRTRALHVAGRATTEKHSSFGLALWPSSPLPCSFLFPRLPAVLVRGPGHLSPAHRTTHRHASLSPSPLPRRRGRSRLRRERRAYWTLPLLQNGTRSTNNNTVTDKQRATTHS